MLKLKSKMGYNTPQIIILLGSHFIRSFILDVPLIHSGSFPPFVWFIHPFRSFVSSLRSHFFIPSIDSDGTNTRFVHSSPRTDWDIFKQFMTHRATQAVYPKGVREKMESYSLDTTPRYNNTMIRHDDTTTNHDKYTTNRMIPPPPIIERSPCFVVWFVEWIVYWR